MDSRYSEIEGHLRELLAPYVNDNQVIEANTRLVDDLGLASMQVMELLMELEDRLDVSIPQNILPDVETFDDLVRALDANIA